MLPNRSLALSLLALAVGMLMLAYASVPLYRLFCEVTGFGGTTRRGEASQTVSERTITVRFNADTAPALPWEFTPDQREMRVKIGENSLAHYQAYNTSDKPVTGHATYNVLPASAGIYFVKVACFCFENQLLNPGQRMHMPVSFFIDPAILDDPEMNDVRTITLSYTFFEAKKPD